MKIWLLRQRGRATASTGTAVTAFVIVADNGADARDLAARRALAEGPRVWTDASLTSCRSIGEATRYVGDRARHVLAREIDPEIRVVHTDLSEYSV